MSAIRFPMALLRANYNAMVRYPLRVVDDNAISRLDETAPLRLAYQGFVADLDDAAARLLGDEAAEARAQKLREWNRGVRATYAASRRHAEYRLAIEGRRRMDRYQRVRRAQLINRYS